MRKSAERFSKIYIFDINPGNDDITKELIMGKLSRVIKNISLYQYVIFVSHSSLKVLKKIAQDAKINLGYVVSDGGARIYNLSSKRVSYEKTIDKTEANEIFHTLSTLDLLSLYSTSKSEFMYSFDEMNAYILNKLHYVNLPTSSSYQKVKELIDQNNIYSILVFQKTDISMDYKIKALEEASELWNVSITNIDRNCFIIYDKSVGKYNSILKIIQSTGITNFKNIYYYAINSIDSQCYNSFSNHLVCSSAFYEAKQFNSSIFVVPYDSFLEQIILSAKQDVNDAKKKNVFMNPSSSIKNTDEKTVNLKDLK